MLDATAADVLALSSMEVPNTRVHTHPGEVLLEEFMAPLGLSASALARELHVAPSCIAELISLTQRRSVTPNIALRLGRYLGTTPEFWINLQAGYDQSKARSEQAHHGKQEIRKRSV